MNKLDFLKPRPSSQLPETNLQDLADLCAAAPDGCIVELGVYKGGSAWALSEVARGRRLHLFDTFEGIPQADEIDKLKIGDFGDVEMEEIIQWFPTAALHIGMFPDTFWKSQSLFTWDIAFLHIDCDQYATCKNAIEILWPKVVPNGIMAFDDWPLPGIQKAVIDYFGGDPIHFSPVHIPYVIKK